MAINYLKYELEKLTNDENDKIATLAQAVLELMENSNDPR